jgi:hypothetical protein
VIETQPGREIERATLQSRTFGGEKQVNIDHFGGEL